MKKSFVALGAVALLLTGCANEVELSDNDSKRVAQYAADALLRYDANYQERLLTAQEVSEAKEKLRLMQERQEAVQELLNKEKHPADEKTDENSTASDGKNGQEGENTETVRMEEDVNDVLGIPGLTFSMDGYQVYDEYSDLDQETGHASVNVSAKDGEKLLAVNCIVTNGTGQDCECDLFAKDIESTVTINGSVKKKGMMTLLLNDFGTFQKTLAPGESVTTVMIFEISESDANISELQLNLNVGGTEHTIKL